MIRLAIDPRLFATEPGLRVYGFAAASLDRASAHLSARDLDERWITPVPLMSLTLATAARHVVSIRGHDVDALPARTITLRRVRPNDDWFVPLGATPNDVHVDANDLVLACETLVLELLPEAVASRQTCLRADSRRAVFVSHALSERDAGEATAALVDLRGQLAALGSEVGDAMFADATAPEVTLTVGRERRETEKTDDT